MGKSTISMAIFNSFLLVHQRVISINKYWSIPISGDLILSWTRGAFETHHGQFSAIRHEFVAATLWPHWSRSEENAHSDTIILYQSINLVYISIVLYHSLSFYQFLYKSFLDSSVSFYLTLSNSSFYIILCHSMSFIVIRSHSISSYNSISFYCILIIQFYIILYHLSLYQVLSCIRPSLSFHFLSIDDNVWLKRRILHRERGIGYG